MAEPQSTAANPAPATAPAAAPAAAATPVSPLAAALSVTPTAAAAPTQTLEDYIRLASQAGARSARDVILTIRGWIANLDDRLSAQVNEILHTPEFQRLEAAWRGLQYLVAQTDKDASVRIRTLNISKRDLFRDLDRAVEFDQSQLFKKVYEEGFGQIGGEPFGLLIGDFAFDRSAEDISCLKKLSGLAAAAHAPFVGNANPGLMNMDSWTELMQPRDLSRIFDSEEYASWNSFRKSEDSRYVALALPRVLARRPYGEGGAIVRRFFFEEHVDGQDTSKCLWMHASWVYAARVVDAFAQWGWLARTRGIEGGGLVENLPVHTFATDAEGVAVKAPTEVLLSDRREFELSALGFLPLLHIKGTDQAVFMGAQSFQKPQVYHSPEATANAELSTKFNYILNVARFAHYVKVMARDKTGTQITPGEAAEWLNKWIEQYVTPDPTTVSEEKRAKQPLAEARIEVREAKGKPGFFEAVVFLRPHYQLEALSASMRLTTDVPKPKS
ncbi:MAG TPA: type VI secretion system contractile sheath large subunit [Gemmatales bacterium]|nr:type VI secretion system contractile sheath large subunit [Gemmatales bacterium]